MSAQENQVQTASGQMLTLQQELAVLQPEISKVLPEHVTAEKFMRVVATAIAQNPDLRRSAQIPEGRRALFTACVRCATDGLVPDGREAALVLFANKADLEPQRLVRTMHLKRLYANRISVETISLVIEFSDIKLMKKSEAKMFSFISFDHFVPTIIFKSIKTS